MRVSPSGTKIAHRSSDLAGYAGLPRAEMQALLTRLAADRIVRPLGGDVAEGERKLAEEEKQQQQKQEQKKKRLFAALEKILLAQIHHEKEQAKAASASAPNPAGTAGTPAAKAAPKAGGPSKTPS